MKAKSKVFTILLIICSFPIVALANDIEKKSPISVSGKVSVFSRYTNNPYFGAEDSRLGYTPDKIYSEIAATVAVTGEQKTDLGLVTGQVGAYFGKTIGDDFYGQMKSNTNNAWEAAGYDSEADEVLLNQAWIKLGNAFSTNFDITVGRQDIALEKGFVVWGNPRLETAAWTNFQQSFPFAVRVDHKTDDLLITALFAQAERYSAGAFENDVKLYGANVHYDFNDSAYIYGSVFKKDEPSLGETSSMIDDRENDTVSYDLGLDMKINRVQIEFEGAYQTGDVKTLTDKFDRESYAYWGALTYNFPVALNPYVRSSYYYFSGDDANSSDVEAYDPMFSGFSGWNKFYIGEFVGENQLVNSNKESIVLETGFSPVEKVNLAFMYIIHNLAEKNTEGNKHWADEINVIADYFLSETIYVHGGLGYAMPNDAAEDAYGSNDDGFFAQAQVVFNF
ncbi:hypothetical protein [Seleniivibrio sp.]|uniref:hypothetical protein n=1 Tax=Seleniivibrio sp. TaxID=2898801 RepID=UPI0025D87484|nr:hypothetical protein [Seleniivibrio sp.]MCD8553587.1 alginate export family protein [Seleniivibrio sp.]